MWEKGNSGPLSVSMNQYNHFGKEYGGFSKKKKKKRITTSLVTLPLSMFEISMSETPHVCSSTIPKAKIWKQSSVVNEEMDF
jgi:hypothetical protein